jgi:hypothetical protein
MPQLKWHKVAYLVMSILMGVMVDLFFGIGGVAVAAGMAYSYAEAGCAN